MFDDYRFTCAERLMRYVQIDTQSDPASTTQPSTEKQKDLSRLLVQELQDMGITDAHTDAYGYVYATLPANTTKAVPVICLCSHVDTAPDEAGTGVKPILHRAWNGEDMQLPDDLTVVISQSEFPYLRTCIGHDLITASGTTLLGGDDKAGVAAIMDAVHYLITHPQIKRGTIRILFTPDEEVGRGTDKLDIAKLGAQYGYTLDGGDRGSLEDETFSADSAELIIYGVMTHPGDAKEKMVNALKLAGVLLARLPQNLSPENTSGKEGFIHPTAVRGGAAMCTVEFILRDFDTRKLSDHAGVIRKLADALVQQEPRARYTLHVQEQYRNMKEVLSKHPQVVAYAKEALQRAGFAQPVMESIRGGTDGSRLSFMGLPTANLFTGMQAIHSKKEYISVQDMNKAVESIVHLVQVWEEKS